MKSFTLIHVEVKKMKKKKFTDQELENLLYGFKVSFNRCPICGSEGIFGMGEYLGELFFNIVEQDCSCKLELDDFLDEEGQV